MAAYTPFEPSVKSGTAGFTQVVVVPSAGANTVINVNIPTATAVLVQAFNANAAATSPIAAYIRYSVESSTSITATATDTPIVIPPQGTTVQLFASPAGGVLPYNIAVTVTVSPTVAGSYIAFTPGTGGDGPA